MDELKLLVETVAGLPVLTLWVLGGYLVYKLAILGSLYGTIRYLADKFVEWRNAPPLPPAPKEMNLHGITINEDVARALVAQIMRLSGNTAYIHTSDVNKLKNVIDAMLEKKE